MGHLAPSRLGRSLAELKEVQDILILLWSPLLSSWVRLGRV